MKKTFNDTNQPILVRLIAAIYLPRGSYKGVRLNPEVDEFIEQTLNDENQPVVARLVAAISLPRGLYRGTHLNPEASKLIESTFKDEKQAVLIRLIAALSIPHGWYRGAQFNTEVGEFIEKTLKDENQPVLARLIAALSFHGWYRGVDLHPTANEFIRQLSSSRSEARAVQTIQRILYVDDEPNFIIRHAPKAFKLLQKNGQLSPNTIFEVAKSGKDALESIRRNMPDVILLDLEMPNSEGIAAPDAGIEVAKRIRSEFPDKQIDIVIATTNPYMSMNELNELVESGALQGWLDIKPTQPDDMLELLNLAISHRSEVRDGYGKAFNLKQAEAALKPYIGKNISVELTIRPNLVATNEKTKLVGKVLIVERAQFRSDRQASRYLKVTFLSEDGKEIQMALIAPDSTASVSSSRKNRKNYYLYNVSFRSEARNIQAIDTALALLKRLIEEGKLTDEQRDQISSATYPIRMVIETDRMQFDPRRAGIQTKLKELSFSRQQKTILSKGIQAWARIANSDRPTARKYLELFQRLSHRSEARFTETNDVDLIKGVGPSSTKSRAEARDEVVLERVTVRDWEEMKRTIDGWAAKYEGIDVLYLSSSLVRGFKSMWPIGNVGEATTREDHARPFANVGNTVKDYIFKTLPEVSKLKSGTFKVRLRLNELSSYEKNHEKSSYTLDIDVQRRSEARFTETNDVDLIKGVGPSSTKSRAEVRTNHDDLIEIIDQNLPSHFALNKRLIDLKWAIRSNSVEEIRKQGHYLARLSGDAPEIVDLVSRVYSSFGIQHGDGNRSELRKQQPVALFNSLDASNGVIVPETVVKQFGESRKQLLSTLENRSTEQLEEGRQALGRLLGINLTASNQIVNQEEVMGLSPNLADVPDLVASIVQLVNGNRRVIIFAGTKQQEIELEKVLPQELVQRSEVRIVTTANLSSMWHEMKVSRLLAFGLPTDQGYLNQLGKLLKDKLEIIPQIASLERIESVLGIVGYVKVLADQFRARWTQFVAA